MARPRQPEPKAWADLTHNQQRVIKWMVENDKDHLAAIAEKMVANNTVYAVWTLPRMEKWQGFYRDHLASLVPPLSAEEQLERDIDALAGLAVRVMRDTLQAGEGNSTAVRAAQWVLDGVKAARVQRATPAQQVPNSAPDSAERELAAVLRLVK